MIEITNNVQDVLTEDSFIDNLSSIGLKPVDIKYLVLNKTQEIISNNIVVKDLSLNMNLAESPTDNYSYYKRINPYKDKELRKDFDIKKRVGSEPVHKHESSEDFPYYYVHVEYNKYRDIPNGLVASRVLDKGTVIGITHILKDDYTICLPLGAHLMENYYGPTNCEIFLEENKKYYLLRTTELVDEGEELFFDPNYLDRDFNELTYFNVNKPKDNPLFNHIKF